jgi:hypothetical protein
MRIAGNHGHPCHCEIRLKIILKIIATLKKRDIKNILGELEDDYIEPEPPYA